MNFLFAHNKIALIEKETEKEYLTYQYQVEDGWELLVTKTGGTDPTFNLYRLKNSGKDKVLLKGIKKTYLDKYSKNPKQPLEPEFEK